MKLETLYKTTKTNAIQVCSIAVENEVMTVHFGQLGGKMQNKSTTCYPKNVGRSNETTAAQQALLEAEAKWEKKVKEGYSTDKSAPTTVSLPQKVKVYQEQISNVTFPSYSTPKLNGLNATYWLIDDELVLTSRGGNEYPDIPHLNDSIKEYLLGIGTDCVNGELYIPGKHLQDITSAVKSPKALSKLLQFWVFELPNVAGPYKDKLDMLQGCLPSCTPVLVTSHEDIQDHYDACISNGYEGTVIYRDSAEYQFNVRSSDVLKYKIPKEGEFKVVGYALDKNNHIVYRCESPGGVFKVKRKGTDEERLLDAKAPETNVSRWLTVEYEMLSKSGIPLKPVGLDFRNCNDSGEPQE